MNRLFISTLTCLMLAALPASAACFADYKAKKDNPLRLHYGVIEIPSALCGGADVALEEVKRRIAAGGWTLLNVISVFDEAGLEQRKESAANFFLRF